MFIGQEAQIPSFLSATQLFSYWDRLRTSFWFLPTAMASGALMLSFALIELDTIVSTEWVAKLGWLYSFGPEGARAILSAIASSMITVAGLTFSITMLTLQLASSQFGPRLLRNFMRDRGNQVVLGTFIATFVYCLLVLRTVRGAEGSSFVPHLSVAFGVILALASIAVLIYFIHHVATAIRIESILKMLATETCAAIDRLYPERLGRDLESREAVPARQAQDISDSDFRFVPAETSGYVQSLDEEALIRIAIEHDLVVVVVARPGRFVTQGTVIFKVNTSDRSSDKISDLLRGIFVVGQERTPYQDLEFSLRRIVEIAQRALSPGINDPTTALYCIDRLGEAFGRLARREIPAPIRCDDEGHLRIITEVVSLDEMACSAFAAIARYAVADADVVKSLLRAIDNIRHLAGEEGCVNLIRLSEQIRRCSEEQLQLEFDRYAVQEFALAKVQGASTRNDH